MARQLGLPVSTDMPPLIHQLMEFLYPQSGQGRPSVILDNAPSAIMQGRCLKQQIPTRRKREREATATASCIRFALGLLIAC